MKFTLTLIALAMVNIGWAGNSPAAHSTTGSGTLTQPVVPSGGSMIAPASTATTTAAVSLSKRDARHLAKAQQAAARLQQLMAHKPTTAVGTATHSVRVATHALKAAKHVRKLEKNRTALDQTTSILVGALIVLLIILAFAIEPILGLVILLVGVTAALFYLLS